MYESKHLAFCLPHHGHFPRQKVLAKPFEKADIDWRVHTIGDYIALNRELMTYVLKILELREIIMTPISRGFGG
jgi:hypothetical protein